MKLIKVAALKVTPLKAHEMLEQMQYTRQRVLREDAVTDYAAQMKDGEFQEYSDIEIAYAPNGDGTNHAYLINGQHRLHSIIEAGITHTFVAKHIQFESVDEIDMRYAVIDTQKKRNIDDMNRALGLSDKLGIQEYQLGWLGSAVLFMQNGFRRSKRYSTSIKELVALESRYAPAAVHYFGYLHGGHRQLSGQMRRQGAMALGLVAIDESMEVYGREKIMDFFHGVAHDDGLASGDPRKVAVRHLYEVATGPSAKGARIQQDYTCRFLALCFNAWVEERALKMTRVVDPRKSMVINGSKFQGK